MDIKKTLQEYLEEISSNSPTPGGGNVAALCGTLSASLGIMVCNLTIGKKKYADVEQEMDELRNKLKTYTEKFIALGKKDNEAFNKVMDAFKLPKESDEQKKIRAEEIEKSTLEATSVPAEIVKTCRELITLLVIITKKGNQNLVTDAGVGILIIAAASEGAFLNVLINYSALTEKQKAAELLSRTSDFNDEVKREAHQLITEITNKLRGN